MRFIKLNLEKFRPIPASDFRQVNSLPAVQLHLRNTIRGKRRRVDVHNGLQILVGVRFNEGVLPVEIIAMVLKRNTRIRLVYGTCYSRQEAASSLCTSRVRCDKEAIGWQRTDDDCYFSLERCIK